MNPINIEYLKSGVAEVQLTYKNKVKPSQMYVIHSSSDIYAICKTLFDDGIIEHREQFILILMNKANKVLGYVLISSGRLSGTVADPCVIFQACLKANANQFICAHNHPSGNLRPSETDIQLTRKLRDGGKLLDIAMLDHLIITNESFYSFADEGLMN